MEDVYRINRPCGGINRNLLSSYNPYPYQSNFVGHTIMIRFLDENDAAHIIHERINLKNENFKPVFKILRWDYDSDGIVVLANKKNQIVVTTSKELMTHKWYKKNEKYDDIVFMLPDEILEHLTEEEYIEQYYSKEKVYPIGQDSKHVNSGEVILIEYENDRNGLVSREHFNPKTIDYDEIARRVIESLPEREGWPKEVLRSFDSYFNEHRHSEIDIPMRYSRTGVLVKDDKYHTVVLTYNQTTGDAEFLVDDEANFYLCWKFDNEIYQNGGQINLWQC